MNKLSNLPPGVTNQMTEEQAHDNWLGESKPILVLDFDGVLHSYKSGWQGETVILDPPTPNMVIFLRKAIEHFNVQILSSRSKYPDGIEAMKKWLVNEIEEYYNCVGRMGNARDIVNAHAIITSISFPTEKPAAFLTIDDRAICFDGNWPDPKELLKFQPWYKKEPATPDISAPQRFGPNILPSIFSLLRKRA